MSDDETTQDEVDPSLFAPPSAGGGAFWQAKAGGYRLQLLSFSKGPEVENEKDVTIDGKKTKQKVKEVLVRWSFAVHRLSNGKRLTFTVEEGEKSGQALDAVADGLSSRTFSKGSKAGKWLRVLLDREIDWKALVNASPTEAAAMQAAIMQEAIGKWALGTFGAARGSDKIVLTELAPLDTDEEGDDD